MFMIKFCMCQDTTANTIKQFIISQKLKTSTDTFDIFTKQYSFRKLYKSSNYTIFEIVSLQNHFAKNYLMISLKNGRTEFFGQNTLEEDLINLRAFFNSVRHKRWTLVYTYQMLIDNYSYILYKTEKTKVLN